MEMTVRPILFSGPMVRALLQGRKTQTRRVLTRARVFATPETPAFTLSGAEMERALQNADKFRRLGDDGWYWESDAFEWQAPSPRTGWMAHIGYAPGDLLYVRETWSGHHTFRNCPPGKRQSFLCPDGFFHRDEIWFWADGSPELGDWEKPRPGMHMPRWASRLTLKVTGVRVQRLQDITEEDAVAEGVEEQPYDGDDERFIGEIGYRDYRDHPHNVVPFCFAETSFATLWDSLNEKRGFGWDVNPWVVAVTFEVHRCNVESFEKEKAA